MTTIDTVDELENKDSEGLKRPRLSLIQGFVLQGNSLVEQDEVSGDVKR